MSTKNQYHFTTSWKLEARPEEVFRILDDAQGLPRWWPSVYLDLQTLEQGDAQGIGKVIELYTKGWLPYTLKWKFRRTKKQFPSMLALEAFGDLQGQGLWTIQPDSDGKQCEVRYEWSVSAQKPILRYFSFLLKPIFSANHHWAMRKGEQSIRLEILRRRLKTEAERAQIPAPPGPTFPHNLTNNKIFTQKNLGPVH